MAQPSSTSRDDTDDERPLSTVIAKDDGAPADSASGSGGAAGGKTARRKAGASRSRSGRGAAASAKGSERTSGKTAGGKSSAKSDAQPGSARPAKAKAGARAGNRAARAGDEPDEGAGETDAGQAGRPPSWDDLGSEVRDLGASVAHLRRTLAALVAAEARSGVSGLLDAGRAPRLPTSTDEAGGSSSTVHRATRRRAMSPALGAMVAVSALCWFSYKLGATNAKDTP